VLARIPAAARPETMKGAEAYATFFLQSVNRSAQDGDPSILDELYTQDCATCVAMRASVEDLRAQQRRHAGDTLVVRRASTLSFTKEKRTVQLDVDQRAVSILDAAGRSVGRTQAGSGAFVMTLSFVNGRWVANRLQTVSS
jgi:hypothetical protein